MVTGMQLSEPGASLVDVRGAIAAARHIVVVDVRGSAAIVDHVVAAKAQRKYVNSQNEECDAQRAFQQGGHTSTGTWFKMQLL